jgi:DNA-binding IclR family transcriptional regulator
MTAHTPEKDEKTAKTRQVPALTRGIKILRRLASSDQSLGVNQIARDTDLIPSTCLHILRTLVEEGLADFDEETKRYNIGIGILPLARTVILKNGFTQVVQPHLDELAEDFAITSIGVQTSGRNQMIAVAIARTQLPFRLQVDIGSRFPAYISATGRCFAAFSDLPKKTLEGHFKKLIWDNPPSFDTWMDQVKQTKERGYGIDNGEYIRGITVLSAPVFNKAGAVSHAIVSVGVSEQMENQGIDSLAERMLKAAHDTSNFLLN